jgi:hypothetical protein
MRRGQSSFGGTFRADNQGCRRAIWSIHVVCGMDELSEELFRAFQRALLTDTYNYVQQS